RERWGRRRAMASAIRRAVGFHLVVSQLAENAPRQDDLDEHILVENEALSVGGARRGELSITAAREIVPSARVCNRFIIDNRLYLLRTAPGTIEADGRSPVVQDQRDVPGELQRVKPRIHVACVVDKAVGLGR